MKNELPIYLDHNATTPVDPRVVHIMMPLWRDRFGNAASRHHAHGWQAKDAVDNARGEIAKLIGASASEIVLCSGATEANNLALRGAISARGGGGHIVTCQTEHRAVLDTARSLEGSGVRVTYLRPGRDGLLSPDQVVSAIGGDTAVVSIMLVNNEIGVVQPVAAIAAAVKERRPGVLIHCDAAQGALSPGLDADRSGLDMVSLSAHKMYGPQGIGALWVRRLPRVRIDPILFGGGHQAGLRPGTVPLALAVGFGEAARLARRERTVENRRISHQRDHLRDLICSALPGVTINGSMNWRTAGNLNLSFAGIEGEALISSLTDISVSSGAACSSAEAGPSYVLSAIGVSPALAHASIRFGVGRSTTDDDIERAAVHVIERVEALRAAVDWRPE